MKAIIALEEMIKDDETHLKLDKKQLSDHESGTNRLTNLVKASVEKNIEERTVRLEKNTQLLSKLLKQDIQELEKEEQIKEAIIRKNYFHYQKTRLKRDKTRTNDEKLEAIMIIDELPNDIGFEDEDLFRIAGQSLKMGLSLLEETQKIFYEIRKDFDTLTQNLQKEQIADLALLKYQIPVIVLQFHTLVANIKENIEEDNKKSEEDDDTEVKKIEFSGFPKYEDWWIKELWVNHQAYFGLYKWKTIISKLCRSAEQQRTWEIIFANWVNIKKQLNTKGQLAFEYNYAFDTLLREYSGLEEELATTSLDSMENIINTLAGKEDFTKLIAQEDHKLVTQYTQFKREKIDYQDTKGKV